MPALSEFPTIHEQLGCFQIIVCNAVLCSDRNFIIPIATLFLMFRVLKLYLVRSLLELGQI